MRTTIDLPEDLLRIAKSVAHDTHQTLSQTVAGMMRTALRAGDEGGDAAHIYTSPRTGLPVLHLGGGPITIEDVRALDDEP